MAILAILVTLGTFVASGAATVSASPTQAQIDAAKTELANLNDRLSLLAEQYDQASLALARAERQLADARAAAARADAEQARVRELLSARVRQAYEGGAGSQLEILLGASNLQQFSSRLEYLNSVARSDSDLAAEYQVKGQQARRAAAALHRAVDRRTALVRSLAQRKAEIRAGIAQQQGAISRLEAQLALERIAAAKRAAQIKAALAQQIPAGPAGGPAITQPSGSSSGSSGGSSSTGGSDSGGSGGASSIAPVGPPPPVSSGAAAALAAARSAIGVRYTWGGASPATGFDCSGLTMWSWAHAGVSLPHSSAAQYTVVPHVSRDQLQPGDLLFFYSPIHHVGMYTGGGMMIDAQHPGTTVSEHAVWWQYYVGAGRP